eukprot:m.9252 g.9252  ORF g.9252 m.9252 type:complete len:659 (-) comp2615_c0_seq1:188-2164(-)
MPPNTPTIAASTLCDHLGPMADAQQTWVPERDGQHEIRPRDNVPAVRVPTIMTNETAGGRTPNPTFGLQHPYHQHVHQQHIRPPQGPQQFYASQTHGYPRPQQHPVVYNYAPISSSHTPTPAPGVLQPPPRMHNPQVVYGQSGNHPRPSAATTGTIVARAHDSAHQPSHYGQRSEPVSPPRAALDLHLGTPIKQRGLESDDKSEAESSTEWEEGDADDNGDDDEEWSPKKNAKAHRSPAKTPSKSTPTSSKEQDADGTKISNVVFDLADRDTKSERFNKMKPGDRVVITGNKRTGHHDVTGKRRHLVNKAAVVLQTATWPNTWLTVRIDGTKEEVKVRTSNIMMEEDIEEYKELLIHQEKMRAQQMEKAKAAESQPPNPPAPSQPQPVPQPTPKKQKSTDGPASPYKMRPRMVSETRYSDFDSDADESASPKVVSPSQSSSSANAASTRHDNPKRKRTQDEQSATEQPPTSHEDGGFSCNVTGCTFWTLDKNDLPKHDKQYHGTGSYEQAKVDVQVWIPGKDNILRAQGSSLVTAPSYRLAFDEVWKDKPMKQQLRQTMFRQVYDTGSARTAPVVNAREIFDARRNLVHTNKSHKSTAPIYICPVQFCKEKFKDMPARAKHMRSHAVPRHQTTMYAHHHPRMHPRTQPATGYGTTAFF